MVVAINARKAPKFNGKRAGAEIAGAGFAPLASKSCKTIDMDFPLFCNDFYSNGLGMQRPYSIVD
jgi:hypothetical protein